MVYRHTGLSMLATTLRVLGVTLSYWKAILLVFVIVSPIGPHIRWSFSESARTGRLVCTYMGARGLIAADFGPDCPLIALIDTREARP